jgi:HPt (histidine-containing phosphotransfer) domain-containing protein
MGLAAAALDLDHLSHQAGGDKMLMGQVLGLFLEHAETVLEALAVASDAKTWRDQAHSLKGSAKGVGAWSVAEAAFNAEQDPLNPTLIPPIRAAFAQTRAAIASFEQQIAAR